MKKTGKLLVVLVLAAGTALTGCDKTKDDVQPAKITGALTLHDDDYTTLAGTPVNMNVLANDSVGQGAVLTFGTPQHGTVAHIQGTVLYSYTPDSSYIGTDVFSYTVCLNGTCDSAMVGIIISNGTNCQPTANDDGPYTIPNDGQAAIFNGMLINDVLPCPNYIVNIEIGAAHGQTDITSANLITYLPAPGYVGPDQIKYRICNGNYCDEAIISVNVVAPTCQLNAFSDQQQLPMNSQGVFNPLVNDLTCGPVTLTINRPPVHGSYNVNGSNQIIYNPAPGFTGQEEIGYQICGSGQCDTATVYVFVHGATGCGLVQQAVGDTAFVNTGQFTNINVLANDLLCPGGQMTLQVLGQGPTQGTVSVVTVGGVPMFRYYTQVPATPSSGDSFQYQVTNTIGGVPQTFTSWVGIVIQ